MDIVIACKGTPLVENIKYAEKNNTGIEVKAFTSPVIFHSDWHGLLDVVKKQLQNFTGTRTIHGMFHMGPINWNRMTHNQLKEDYNKCLSVAEEIQASIMVLHSTYFPGLTSWKYKDWLNQQVDLWGGLAENAIKKDITLVLENIVDEKPDSLLDVIKEVNSQALKICLDFGHLNLISTELTELQWIEACADYLVYTHMHNNNGRYDSHSCLESGTLNYKEIFTALYGLKEMPKVAVEVDTLDGVTRSLQVIDQIKKEAITTV